MIAQLVKRFLFENEKVKQFKVVEKKDRLRIYVNGYEKEFKVHQAVKDFFNGIEKFIEDTDED